MDRRYRGDPNPLASPWHEALRENRNKHTNSHSLALCHPKSHPLAGSTPGEDLLVEGCANSGGLEPYRPENAAILKTQKLCNLIAISIYTASSWRFCVICASKLAICTLGFENATTFLQLRLFWDA